MSEKYNGYKYKTLEEKKEADKERKRVWASKNRKSYSETIKDMTPEQYEHFLELKRLRMEKYKAKKMSS